MMLTAQQQDVLWNWAGLLPSDEIARRLSEVGPSVSRAGLQEQASKLGISLKKRKRRVFQVNPWSPEEDARLRSLAGRVDIHEITTRLNAEFGSRRRFQGVRKRFGALGLSSEVVGLLSVVEARRILAVSLREVARLLRDGELVAARRPIAPGGVWGVSPSDLEAYIRAHPERVRYQEMAPGAYQTLARQVSLRSPYVTLDDAARLVGLGRSEMCRRLDRGQVSGAVIYQKRWRIPLAGLRAMQDADDAKPPRRTLTERLVDALDKHYQTSVALAELLGTKETGIHSAVNAARSAGHRIEQRAGRGYRLRPSRKLTGVAS